MRKEDKNATNWCSVGTAHDWPPSVSSDSTLEAHARRNVMQTLALIKSRFVSF